MEITKEQIKELVKIAQAIDAENRIDDDVTGGYVEEPYNSIIERIYAVVNECEGKKVDAGENTLPIDGVNGWRFFDDEKPPLNTKIEVNEVGVPVKRKITPEEFEYWDWTNYCWRKI